MHAERPLQPRQGPPQRRPAATRRSSRSGRYSRLDPAGSPRALEATQVLSAETIRIERLCGILKGPDRPQTTRRPCTSPAWPRQVAQYAAAARLWAEALAANPRLVERPSGPAPLRRRLRRRRWPAAGKGKRTRAREVRAGPLRGSRPSPGSRPSWPPGASRLDGRPSPRPQVGRPAGARGTGRPMPTWPASATRGPGQAPRRPSSGSLASHCGPTSSACSSGRKEARP